MDVSKAHNVAVVIGTEWTQLEQKNPGAVWQGEVIHSNIELPHIFTSREKLAFKYMLGIFSIIYLFYLNLESVLVNGQE